MRPVPLGIVGAAVTTCLVVGAYIGLQQHLRSDANHPQVEMARSAASRLDAGAGAQSVVPSHSIDIGASTDPYLIVVDTTGSVVATSAQLDGAAIVPPSGVFGYVRDHGEDVITWQPAPGVRSAIVVDSFHGGFVVAGRSLQPAEDQVIALGERALAAWLVGLIAVGGLSMRAARRL